MRTPSYVNEPQVQYLSTLLKEISLGMLQVPRFQRPFVWDLDRQLELLRSIRDGLPVGAVMVWRTHRGEIACYERLGPHHLTPPTQAEGAVRQYLLDGVQRLSTLFGALYASNGGPGIEEPDDTSLTVYYDLEQEDFCALSPDEVDEAQRPELLRADAFLDTVKLVKLQRRFPEASADRWIPISDEIARAFREYKIAVIPIVTDDLETATRTFQRINSKGMVMSEIHMVHALSWSESFDLLSRIQDLKDEHLAPIHWNDIDDERILDVCKAALGLDVYSTAAESLSHELRTQPEVLDQAITNIARAAEFLLRRCDVGSPGLVPYGHQVTILAEACGLGTAMFESFEELLCTWFWLTTYAEFFAGISGHRLQRALSDMRAMMRDGKPRWSGTRPFARRPLRSTFDFRAARAKALALQLAARAPRDAENKPRDVARFLADQGYRAINPLISRRRAPGTLYGSPGNRFFVRPEQVTWLRDTMLDAARGQLESPEQIKAREDLLHRHVVTEEALDLLAGGDEAGFVRQRQRDLDALEVSIVEELTAKGWA